MKNLLAQLTGKLILLFLCTYLTFFPAWLSAKPLHQSISAPVADALPVLAAGQTQNGWSVSTDSENHYLEVKQTDEKVVIKWDSFDIGSDAHTHFEQVDGGIALNRIYQNSPSRIFGQLTATGNIYLVNQNGILFGEGSRTNIGALVASALNIADEDFQNGLWKYQSENFTGAADFNGPGDVANRGWIESSTGGNIFLLGQNVENSGTISSDGGRIFLAGSSEFEWTTVASTSGKTTTESIVTDYSGSAHNTETGEILADTGRVGMYGDVVRHDGLIRSLSTVVTGSSIQLVASEKVVTGENSMIDSSFKELEDPAVSEIFAKGREIDIHIERDSLNDGSYYGVELYGDIVFPSGEMTVDAADGGRIYLAPGASIDLSGSWVEKSALDKVLSAQLNSLELRDEFLPKNSALAGETIYFLLHEGVSMGNISEHLASRTLSVWEQSMEGGSLYLEAGQGDIIVDSGASIDISGGGIHYAGGYVQTTKLVSDGVAYDIADAPDTLVYDQLINSGTDFNEKYTDYLDAHTEGADAGLLLMSAKQVLYEGDLDASAVRGYYQVNTTDPVDSLGYRQSVGTVIPTGGTLILGSEPFLEFYEDEDPVVDTIVIKDTTSGLAEGFDPETGLLPEERNEETWLSDDLLNNAGLASLQLNATRSLITESGTALNLSSGGELMGSARRILHQGSIVVPSGTVQLSLRSNKSSEQYTTGTTENPDYVSVAELGQERIELAEGSSISTAGEKIDNYTAALTGSAQTELFGWMDGGEIILRDQTLQSRGVVVQEGATLDVSGGYNIEENREILDSGDAGAIEISGGAIILDGEVKGEALFGNDGGSITLHAGEVTVVSSSDDLPDIPEGFSSEDPIPEAYRNRLIIDDDRFDDTGFTSITLKSIGDVTLEENVSLAPSRVKLTLSSPGRFSSGLLEKVNVPLEYAGSSAVNLEAGTREDFSPHVTVSTSAYSQVTIKDNASIQVAPEGTISIIGDGVDISGRFSAPAGTITVNSKSTLDEYHLRIREGSSFHARGFNYQAGYLENGEVLWETADGGDVSFSSASRLIIDNGVVVDVSGSAPVTMYRTNQQGRRYSDISASEPGSISLAFSTFGDQGLSSLTNTVFLAEKQLDSLRGGSFSISALNNAALDIPIEQLQSLADNGFDYLELSSGSNVNFMDSGDVSIARGIRIDTPLITGSQGSNVVLNTQWMQLLNAYEVLAAGQGADAASFTVNSGFIDMTGDLEISDFDQVALNALYDIRLTDTSYTDGSVIGWSGVLEVDHDLTLTASRIYPTSGALFNIEAGGDISILGSGISNTSPIYSALGSLSLSAHSIDHEGVLAAPGGSISLYADETSGRIYLAEGSVLSVALEVPVNYGDVDDESLQWYGWDKITDGEISYVELDELPEKQISLTASEVIGRDDAVISLEGGESVYGYSFVPGTSGSLDPLTQSGRFVVLPAENVMGYLPGQAIYLERNSLLDEGVYVILPEAYAFLEGAMILELQGSLGANDVVLKSAEGYAMAVGYDADSLTGNHSSSASLYTVRQASDVLSEGEYDFVGLETGNGGSLEITASTTILNSEISAAAKNSSYRSGIVTLSGENIVLSGTKAELGSSFDFGTALGEADPDGDRDLSDLIGKLYLDAEKLSESGLWELNIGTSDLTETITFEAESVLTGSRINLAAGGDIIFNVASGIEGTGEDSEISILSDTGSLIMAQDSFVRSFDSIAIDAAGLIRGGEIQAEKQICLSSNNLYLAEEGLYEVTDHIDAVPDEYDTVEISDHLYVIVDNDYKDTFNDGMVVDAAFWQSFSSLEKISFTAREKAGFAGTIAIDAQTSEVAFDAPLIEDISAQGGGDVQCSSRRDIPGFHRYGGNRHGHLF